MGIKKWEQLPEELRLEQVRPYYEILRKKRAALCCKRVFDIVVSAVLLLLLSPVFAILAAAIKLDSKGPVFYRQQRVTQYGRVFRIFKFRTMVQDADRGGGLTVGHDPRVTRVGRVIRKYRLDEISQLIDIFRGTMTFVGTRPEAVRYTECYTPQMMATLLLPAGLTSLASIYYKDEARLLEGADDPDAVYISTILPQKMRHNLEALEHFSFFGEIRIMFMTLFAAMGKDYSEERAASGR